MLSSTSWEETTLLGLDTQTLVPRPDRVWPRIEASAPVEDCRVEPKALPTLAGLELLMVLAKARMGTMNGSSKFSVAVISCWIRVLPVPMSEPDSDVKVARIPVTSVLTVCTSAISDSISGAVSARMPPEVADTMVPVAWSTAFAMPWMFAWTSAWTEAETCEDAWEIAVAGGGKH